VNKWTANRVIQSYIQSKGALPLSQGASTAPYPKTMYLDYKIIYSDCVILF